MQGLRFLPVILATAITISTAATVMESNRVSNLMSAVYQLKARMEMQKLEGMTFQARTFEKLHKIRADLELREETEKLETERIRDLAPRGIVGAPGPVGIAGEPGKPGPPGIPGKRGQDGQDGRTPSEDVLLQDIYHIQAMAQLNRNYLDQLVFDNTREFDTCGGIILFEDEETVKLGSFMAKSCSWVVWSVLGSHIRMKLTGPPDAQYTVKVTYGFSKDGRITHDMPVESWLSVPTSYALIHYNPKSMLYYHATLMVQDSIVRDSNTRILPTYSFVHSEPFALTYPLAPATQYQNNERTFIIGKTVCNQTSTSVRIHDMRTEANFDWVETSWLDTTVNPSQLRYHRFSEVNGGTLYLPDSTSFVTMFYTDGGVVGSGFKIQAECRQ